MNIMIYGVTIILNDCNFSLRNRDKQVEERFSKEAFFTNQKIANDFYEYYLQRVNNESSVVYGRYELRGRCEFYKCEINNGQIMNHGTIIKKHDIR